MYASFSVYAADQIQEQLPPDLIARVRTEENRPRDYSIVIFCTASKDRVITVVKLLKPSKVGRERETYQQFQRDHLANGVNLVEIDLIRSGCLRSLCRGTTSRTFSTQRLISAYAAR